MKIFNMHRSRLPPVFFLITDNGVVPKGIIVSRKIQNTSKGSRSCINLDSRLIYKDHLKMILKIILQNDRTYSQASEF